MGNKDVRLGGSGSGGEKEEKEDVNMEVGGAVVDITEVDVFVVGGGTS